MNTPWLDVERLGHLERPVGVLGRDGAVAPGVAAGERDAAVGEPGGQRQAGAGLPSQIESGSDQFSPQPVWNSTASPGAGLDAGDVVDADHVAGPGLAVGDVDQPAAGHDLRHGLDAEPR